MGKLEWMQDLLPLLMVNVTIVISTFDQRNYFLYVDLLVSDLARLNFRFPMYICSQWYFLFVKCDEVQNSPHRSKKQVRDIGKDSFTLWQ